MDDDRDRTSQAGRLGRSAASRRSEARKHHFVTQSYLRGFADGEGYLRVIDLERGSERRQLPKEVAHQRDFFRVGAPGVPPNLVEDAMEQIEGPAVEAVRRVVSSEEAMSDEDRGHLLALVALHASRVPRVRQVRASFWDATSKSALGAMLSSREAWDATQAGMERSGLVAPREVPYEEMRDYAHRGQFSVGLGQTHEVMQAVQMADLVCDMLLERHWSVLEASPHGCPFVCSDDPVGLWWSTPKPPSSFGPGFGLPDTDVTFPLTSTHALLGRFERQPDRARASRKQVAIMNTRTCMGAKAVFASTLCFRWLRADDIVQRGGLLSGWLAQHGAKEGPGPAH